MAPRGDRSEEPGSGLLRRRSLLAPGAALPVLAVTPPASAQTRVVVEPSIGQQTILGFGGMNHPGWIGDLTAAQHETAFGNGAGQLGFTAARAAHPDQLHLLEARGARPTLR
jgi:glucuronoarabinoxylan endo-1,4-beta-xylanase